jgi:hypothetical protein
MIVREQASLELDDHPASRRGKTNTRSRSRSRPPAPLSHPDLLALHSHGVPKDDASAREDDDGLEMPDDVVGQRGGSSDDQEGAEGDQEAQRRTDDDGQDGGPAGRGRGSQWGPEAESWNEATRSTHSRLPPSLSLPLSLSHFLSSSADLTSRKEGERTETPQSPTSCTGSPGSCP